MCIQDHFLLSLTLPLYDVESQESATALLRDTAAALAEVCAL